MDLSLFKQDIDELINEFTQAELTTFTDMKRVWMSRKFSYIYEASPTKHLGFFMQTLYAHTIDHMVNGNSFSQRLGGFYCLYCLYGTQPFKPPFRIYISTQELAKIKDLVVVAKEKGINVVVALVKKMLEKSMFLYGSMDLNEASLTQKIKHLTELQNSRVQFAYKKLFEDTRIDHFLHMDLGEEIDSDDFKQISMEYAKAKRQAIEGACTVVDVQNIKHIVEDNESIGDKLEKLSSHWDFQKEAFSQQTGQPEECTDREVDDDGFDELERLMFQT